MFVVTVLIIFYAIKEGNAQIKNILLLLLQILLFGSMGQFDPKRTQPHNSTTALRIFFQTFYNESGQQVHENYINGFSKKKVLFGTKRSENIGMS